MPNAGLAEIHPGVPAATETQPAGPRTANITTLSNGIRVASITSTSPLASVGVYVAAGSRHETRDVAGATHFLKHLAFKSTSSRPTIQVVRDLEANSASFAATAGREHLLFESETAPEHAPALLSVLGDLLHPRIANFEVERQKPALEEEVQHLSADPVSTLIELLHREAFRNRGLGQSLTAPHYNIEHMDHEKLAQYANTHYTPRNTVVVAVGIPHNELVESVQKSFSGSSSQGDAPAKAEPSKYVGGEVRVPSGGDTHFALAFEGVSANDAKDALAVQVLRQMLGGGSRFSRDGPGNGLQSSLHANVVAPNADVKSVLAFNINYSDSGLFGIYGKVSGNVSNVIDSIVKEVSATLAKADESAVNRAKQLLKLEVLTGKSSDVLHFLGQQALTGASTVHTPEQRAAAIEGVSAADVARVAARVFATKPTLVVLGDVSSVPSVDAIRSSLSHNKK